MGKWVSDTRRRTATCESLAVHVSSNLRARLHRESMRIFCRSEDIPFLVGGAFALGSYTGVTRHHDFDIFMRSPDVTAPAGFSGSGFPRRHSLPHWLAKIHHGEAFIDVIFNSGNGLCQVDDRWFQKCPAGRLARHECCPGSTRGDHLAKAFHGEERFDGADIAHLALAQGNWTGLVCLNVSARIGRSCSPSRIVRIHRYPSRRSLIPRRDYERIAGSSGAGFSGRRRCRRKLCNGIFSSPALNTSQISSAGALESAPSSSRTAITPEQLQSWTSAIETPRTHG